MGKERVIHHANSIAACASLLPISACTTQLKNAKVITKVTIAGHIIALVAKA